MKIHVDASIARNQNRGAASAVCRDAHGNYVGSSSLVIEGVSSVATMEAIAFREALSLADNLMLHSFIVASDSKQVALMECTERSYQR